MVKCPKSWHSASSSASSEFRFGWSIGDSNHGHPCLPGTGKSITASSAAWSRDGNLSCACRPCTRYIAVIECLFEYHPQRSFGAIISAELLLMRWRHLPAVDPMALRSDLDETIDSTI